VHSHNSNCIYSVAESNGNSIEFSLSITEQRAVGFIPAWSLAFLQYTSLSVRVSRIGAKLVCLSTTSKQAKVALECCHAVQGWKWRCSLTENIE